MSAVILIEMPYCVACGCTEFTPCETPSGPCGWTVSPVGGRGMCSRCAQHFAFPKAVVRAVAEELVPTKKPRR
jgi:hypothetical protein